ncbi:MAG: sulfatase family protein [Promethearchaeota archaeon]
MPKKMNVLFIISDQHRADHQGCTGNPDVKTPNLDQFAGEGVQFSNAFCANPMCMPNRATIFTGLYPNAHGVRSNGINLPSERRTIADTLRDRGYITASVGKIHLQFFAPPFRKKTKSLEAIHDWLYEDTKKEIKEELAKGYYGLEHVEMVCGHGDLCTGHYSDWLEERAPEWVEYIKEGFNKFFDIPFYDTEVPEELYSTTYVEERTINFLENFAKGQYGDKPFFMHCSFPDPHHPVTPPGKYKDMYDPDKIAIPESFYHRDELKEHPYIGASWENPLFKGALLRYSTEEEVRKFVAGTYGMISMMDHSIGNILASLEKLGLADNTIVIYTSDHGDFGGEHGMILKGPSPFNGILQVPMMWRVPGLTKPAVTDSLMSSVDIPMTILKLLGIRERHYPPEMQGFDITPVLKDPQAEVRDCCLVEHDEDIKVHSVRLRHLITKDHRITLYRDLEGYGDIYDRKNDPDELNNLWDKDKDLRNKLIYKLCIENMKAQSHLPQRVSLT